MPELLTASELEIRQDKIQCKTDRENPLGKDTGPATVLIPVLFDIAKSLMRLRCAVEKGGHDTKLLAEFSAIESAIQKMALEIESLGR